MVMLGSIEESDREIVPLEASDGTTIHRHPVIKKGNIICTKEQNGLCFIPDLIIVNNDLSSGAPEILKGVTQTIVPKTGQGWYRRKKSIHFDAYVELAKQFAEAFGLDWWRIAAIHHKCGRINFRERKGIDCVALGTIEGEKCLHLEVADIAGEPTHPQKRPVQSGSHFRRSYAGVAG